MKTVTVKFTDRYSESRNTYDYLVEDSVAVEVGDYAVAHNSKEYAIVAVQSVTNGASARATKTLVTILNKETVDNYNAMNVKVKEQKNMFMRLEQLLAQESENNKYRLLAQSNTEAAEILAKLGLA